MDKSFKPWTTLSRAPPKFQSCFLLPRVETGGQKKSNRTAGLSIYGFTIIYQDIPHISTYHIMPLHTTTSIRTARIKKHLLLMCQSPASPKCLKWTNSCRTFCWIRNRAWNCIRGWNVSTCDCQVQPHMLASIIYLASNMDSQWSRC